MDSITQVCLNFKALFKADREWVIGNPREAVVVRKSREYSVKSKDLNIQQMPVDALLE